MTNPAQDFDTILVANRGEIACRVIHTVRRMGLRSVAVYSAADAAAPHVKMADHAVCIGPPPAAESYLDGKRVIDAALESGSGAVHPGYGFLSENSEFAEACAAAGLVFIGPSPAAIAAMGNKAEAKRLMLAAGVPCVPGFHGDAQSDAALLDRAAEIGFPLMVKAAAGGGGRGMRLVATEPELADALRIARSEAMNAFGSDELILERAIIEPRHVEIQVIADSAGHILHLGERDCSIQRRHQKIIEESPCPVLTKELREEMGSAAIRAAAAIDYTGAGTVEFLLDQQARFYFLEMNTRLQVEHPVTELVTGHDLVEMQIRIARGEQLDVAQDDISIAGHAIEARLYTEDTDNDFLPGTGRVEDWRPPRGTGVRVDAGIDAGQTISSHYDPLAAKIVAWGETRDIARRRLIAALRDTVLFGPKTNRAFLISCLGDAVFARGEATTGFVGDLQQPDKPAASSMAVAAAALLFVLDRQTALVQGPGVAPMLLDWSSGFRPVSFYDLEIDGEAFAVALAPCGDETFRVTTGGVTSTVAVTLLGGGEAALEVNGERARLRYRGCRDGSTWLSLGSHDQLVGRRMPGQAIADTEAADGLVRAAMHGVVQSILVSEGDTVSRGDPLLIMEAMKMQREVLAPTDGTVSDVHTRNGQQVATGDALIRIDTDDR